MQVVLQRGSLADYFDLVPVDPRSLSARDWDAEIDAGFDDEPDPLVRLRQEVQALYGEFLDRQSNHLWEECAGCEVLRNYGWRHADVVREPMWRRPRSASSHAVQLVLKLYNW